MPITRAEELIQKLGTDQAFRSKLQNAADPEARRKVLNDYGFSDVQRADLEAYAKTHATELSDAELEAVAGGRTTSWISVVIESIGLSLAAAAL